MYELHKTEGLLDHKNKVHSTKYQCSECGNCYGDTYKLNVHMMKHSEPQFKCRYVLYLSQWQEISIDK